MGTNEQLEAAAVFYEQALDLFSAARADFEAVAALVGPRLRAGRAPTPAELIREEQVRTRLLDAIRRLDIRKGAASADSLFKPTDTDPADATAQTASALSLAARRLAGAGC